ncbi:MAG TPA: hypothetical protein GXX29_14955 [Firmicutes bacterium]|nr:hypothetical protein [Bacillota bacterium]
MKRQALLLMMLAALVLVLGTAGTAAAAAGLDNGSFESEEPPRAKYQGWEDEYIFGWKPFAGSAWKNKEQEHVSVVACPSREGEKCLRLVGVEDNYVGIRSIHIPVEKKGFYTVSAKAFVKELGQPSRCQVWLEFWPADLPAETSTYRIAYHRANASALDVWQDLTVSAQAPDNAATATVLIIIHRTGNPQLPAEVYVDDVHFEAF